MGRAIDEWLAEATPEEVVVPVCFDRKVLGEFDECVTAYEAMAGAHAGMMEKPAELAQLGVRLVELNERVNADRERHRFRFRKVSYDRWEDLLAKHPPTDQQLKRNPFADYDPKTFAPAAIAACCIDPELTVEDVERLRDVLPIAEYERLFGAVFTVNRTGVQIPKSVSSIVDQLASELRSTTPAATESRSASSADE